MRRSMLSKRMGDNLEEMYQTIYTGKGTGFGDFVNWLVNMLSQLADVGMLTNETRKRMEVFLTENVRLANLEIISRKSNDVVLINKGIHEQDSFELSELITWITDELCKDPIMKKLLCGRNHYEGVKAILNTYEERKPRLVAQGNWIDFHIHDNKVYFTKKEFLSIHLYVKRVGEEKMLHFWEIDDDREEQLGTEELLDGRIYYFPDGTVFVETESGYIEKNIDLGNEKYENSRMKGHILGQLENGSIVYIKEGELISLSQEGGETVITKKANWGFTYIGDNEVYWKSYYRKHNQMEECLKDEKLCKEMLWKGLLLTLYNFDGMEVGNKIGNRLRFARFFDQLPIPFTIREIGLRLSEIEKYCYDGSIVKAEGYVEAMSYLMMLEKEVLDEKKTFEELVNLLENVKSNPYTRIANNTGIKLLDCFDFILSNKGLIEHKSDLDDDFDIDVDDFLKKLNRKLLGIR